MPVRCQGDYLYTPPPMIRALLPHPSTNVMDPCGGSFYLASAERGYSELSGALCAREQRRNTSKSSRESANADSRESSMDVPTPVNQGSQFGAPNPEQIYRQDCRYEVDDRLADDQSAMCAITRNDDVPSTTARIDPPQPSAFHKLAESNPLRGTESSDHSVLTAGPPVARRKPRDPIGVLKHLERHAAGRATCLWLSGDGNECGYSSQIDLVKRHIKRVHYHIRPCVCEYCPRAFYNKYTLSLHINSHTGAKPYICEYCGRGFSTPSGKSHHRVHRHSYYIVRPGLA